MQSDRLPQIAFKPLHSTGRFFFWGRGGREEGYGIGWNRVEREKKRKTILFNSHSDIHRGFYFLDYC